MRCKARIVDVMDLLERRGGAAARVVLLPLLVVALSWLRVSLPVFWFSS